jgi:hypothetical protein
VGQKTPNFDPSGSVVEGYPESEVAVSVCWLASKVRIRLWKGRRGGKGVGECR